MLKFKVLILAAACVFVLYGCVSTIESPELNKANEICNERGGVHKITTIISLCVRCNDGHRVDLIK